MHVKVWQNTLGDLTVEHALCCFFGSVFWFLFKVLRPWPIFPGQTFLCTPFNHLSLCCVVYNSPPVSHAVQEAS